MDLRDGRERAQRRELVELRAGRELALGRAAVLAKLLGRERSRVRVLEQIVQEQREQLEERELESTDFDAYSLAE